MAKLSTEDLERLTQDLASLTRAGIPVPDGLRQLAVSAKSRALRNLSEALAGAAGRGVPLSEALGQPQLHVPREFVALMRCAEMSGDFHSLLEFAIQHSRRIRRHHSAILTTLIYPAFVIATMLFTVVVMANFMVPKLIGLYLSSGAELFWTTYVVLGVCRLFHGDTGVCLAVAGAGILLLIVLVPRYHQALFRLVSHLPGFRALTGLSDTALFTGFLSRMVSHAVPLPLALEAAGLALWQPRNREMLQRMSAAAERGQRIGPLLRGDVPSMAAFLFRQAEERGDLAATCRSVAEYCEDRFDRLSKRALAVLEPLLILIVGIAIAVLLSGLYMPLFSIPRVVGNY